MLKLSGDPLTLDDLRSLADGTHVALNPRARQAMANSRALIDSFVEREVPTYGVNTGFGKLSDVHIPASQLAELQLNLVRSHACGFGECLSDAETRVLVGLRINVLAKGYSGARPEVAEALVALLNSGVLPQVPRRGSVGASGDLAPLAHMALTLIGEGQARVQGRIMPSHEALNQAELAPLVLQAKEGLALLNGTQAMTSVGGLALADALLLLTAFTYGGAMTTEGLLGTPSAFDPRIQQIRGQSGQIKVGATLRRLFEASAIRKSHESGDSRVQDAYCLRCMPQVHGAVLDIFEFCREVVERETGAATDNPLVFAEEGDVLSGGNFHGAPVALAFDQAALAITHLASIAERRIDRLVNPDTNEGLPPFLAANAGLESGLMMLHVAAVAALNEMRVLVHPATADNSPTSGAKEDHVSMGMTAANKLRQMVDLAAFICAVEWNCAAQAVWRRLPLQPSRELCDLLKDIEKTILPITGDRPFGQETDQLRQRILSREFSLQL